MIRIHRRASLTAEAALVLPLFMISLATLVSSLLMWLACQRVQASLFYMAEYMAVSEPEEGLADPRFLPEMLDEGLQEEDHRFISEGAEGLDMTGSVIDDPEYVRLSVRCDLVPVTDLFGLIRVPVEKTCVSHVWCGYENGFFDDEEFVYITDDSEVYHVDRNCTHILLTINETTSEEVTDLRNDNGKRYGPCAICHSSLSDGRLFVTPEGDRYHNTVTCSGLKRTVRAVRKSETGDRRPCSRCGR